MQALGATQLIPPEISIQNLKNIQFWWADEGALSPATPIIPYLGGSVQKKLIFKTSAPL